jgi:hypothetical protein
MPAPGLPRTLNSFESVRTPIVAAHASKPLNHQLSTINPPGADAARLAFWISDIGRCRGDRESYGFPDGSARDS